MNHYEITIQNYFPNAKSIKVITNNIVSTIEKEQGIPKEKLLLATSICSDELNHNTHSFGHHFQCGEFILGGITGYPFSGKTGLAAFASHVPDGGAAIIISAPHIGISKEGNIGCNKRNHQSVETFTCGALSGILQNMTSNGVVKDSEDTFDYQMNFMTGKLASKKEIIIQSKIPKIEIVEQAYKIIEKDLKELLTQTKELFFNNIPVYFLGGILINTDDGFDDFFEKKVFRKL